MDTPDQLTIDTPEQIALELAIAGIGSRFLALAVDTVVQVVVLLVVIITLVLSSVGRVPGAAGGSGTLGPALALLALFCLYWGYFAAFEIVWKGQTPGKRAAGIRVIKESGRPIDAPAAILRNLLRAIDFLPGMYGAGLVCMMLNRHSRRIGDFVAGTVVVHDRTGQGLMTPTDTRVPGAIALTSAQAVRLSEQEILLIETYLARRFELSGDVQLATAARIAERIASRTGVAVERGQSTDTYLEMMAREGRDAARFR